MITNYGLATLNAVLNATALAVVLLGARAIQKGQIERHKRLMLTAFTISVVFLASSAHARIFPRGEYMYLEDMGSTNGT